MVILIIIANYTKIHFVSFCESATRNGSKIVESVPVSGFLCVLVDFPCLIALLYICLFKVDSVTLMAYSVIYYFASRKEREFQYGTI